MAITVLLCVRDASGVGAELALFEKTLAAKGWEKAPKVPLAYSKTFSASATDADALRQTQREFRDAAFEADWASTDAICLLSREKPQPIHFDPTAEG